jgi:SAM-dependent methyltransferase
LSSITAAGRALGSDGSEGGKVPVAHLVQVQGAGLTHYEKAVSRLQCDVKISGDVFHDVRMDDEGLQIVDVRTSGDAFKSLLEEIAHVAADSGCPPPRISTYDIREIAEIPAGAGLDYYDQAELWDESSGYENPIEQIRAARLTELVGQLPVKRVLDAGAGNGIVANRLKAMGIDVVAIDHSEAAMARVETPKLVADIGDLPFADDTFDLVLASEVLEHLPNEVFVAARREMGRVARRWVLVTVPNSEDLFCSAVVCPSCRARSSPWRHVRAFSENDFAMLIPGFRPVAVEVFGPIVEYRRRLEAMVTRELLDRWPWPPNALCPQCGFRHPPAEAQRQREALGVRSLKSRIAAPLRRHVPKWIVGTFEIDAGATSR